MTRGNTGSARALSRIAQLESARTPRGATTRLKKFIAADRMDHLEVNRVLVGLGRRGPDRRVVAAQILIVQARVEPLRDGLLRVPGAEDGAVQPVVEFHELLVRGPMRRFRASHDAAY